MRSPEPDFVDRPVGHIPKVYQWLADTIEPFQPADGPPPRKLVPFMRWSLAGSGTQVKLAVAASVSVGVTTVLGFYLIGWVIDGAQAAGTDFLQTQGWQFALFAAFFLIAWPLSLVANAAFNSVTLGPNLYALSLSRLNRHTLGQSLSFFDNDFAGRIAQKSQQTARALTDVVLEVTNIFGNAVAAAFGAVVMLAFVDWRLSLAVVAWLAAYAFIIRSFLPHIRERSKMRAARRAMVTDQIVDTITNIATVKLFAQPRAEEQATDEALAGYREAGIAWASTVVTFRLIIFTLAGMLPVALIGGSLWLWGQGAATAGDIAAAGLVATRLSTMTGWVSFAALGIFTNIGEIEDGIRTLTPPHLIHDKPKAAEPKRSQGHIHFDDVSFGYGTPGAALNRFTLDVRPGEKVALVGQSGAGKSTAMALLLRLYDVEDGAVRLDGQDIRELTQDGLRRQIAMVRQETAMFNRSASDNIRYGHPDATQDQIEAAAAQASAHEFILGLKDHRNRQGYKAHLGERGVKLSGGQRQRIALARAILKDAPILALDEATSALDSEVEAEIQAALTRVMAGKTVLAIAHRLSTIAAMDRIVVMDKGQIVEQGSHSFLLAQNGLYARYWQRQSGGFLGAEPTTAAAE
ncbi:MAG: ABC transporter ATP-binding protein [Pseudomonadota bacterium]